MDIDPGALPDDIDALKDIVRAALAQRDNARADAAAAQAERSDIAAYIAHLKLHVNGGAKVGHCGGAKVGQLERAHGSAWRA